MLFCWFVCCAVIACCLIFVLLIVILYCMMVVCLIVLLCTWITTCYLVFQLVIDYLFGYCWLVFCWCSFGLFACWLLLSDGLLYDVGLCDRFVWVWFVSGFWCWFRCLWFISICLIVLIYRWFLIVFVYLGDDFGAYVCHCLLLFVMLLVVVVWLLVAWCSMGCLTVDNIDCADLFVGWLFGIWCYTGCLMWMFGYLCCFFVGCIVSMFVLGLFADCCVVVIGVLYWCYLVLLLLDVWRTVCLC